MALSSVLMLWLGSACRAVDDPIGGEPSPPSELTAEAVGTTTIRVSWRPSDDPAVTGYELQRRTDLTGTFEPLDAVIGASVSSRVVYFDTDVEPNRYYGYRVRALTQLGARSAISNIAGSKTSPLPGLSIRTATTVATPESADADGFLAVVRGPRDTTTVALGLNGTRLVSPLPAGTYTVLLRGLASNCATRVASDTIKSVALSSDGTETVKDVEFLVSCRDPQKASIVATLAITGDTLDADGVTITASGIIRAPNTPANERVFFETRVLTGATGSVRFDNLRPGDYEISIGDIESPCVLSGERRFNLSPTALAVDTVRFGLTCRKPTIPVDTAGRPFILRHRWASTTARPGDRIALLTSLDLSADPLQQAGGAAADINFDPTVVRYDSARTTGAFDFTIVNKLSAGAISFAAGNTGGQGLTGNIEIVRTWFTVIGTPGSLVTTSTRLGDILTPAVVFLNPKVRVSEATLNISATGANQSPTAVITGPTTATAGTAVSFSGTGSTDPDGSIAAYAWAFGDGTTGSGANVSHTYTGAGTYTVRLTVTDNAGATGTRDQTITVSPAGSAVGSISGTVTSSTRGALVGVTVTVTGGGSAQTSANGAFTISGVAVGARTLTVSALPTGCTAPAPQTVTVTASSTVTANFAVVCAPVGGSTGAVTGFITRGTGGSAIVGATITLTPTGGAALAPVTSDDAGAYTVSGVPLGGGTIAVGGLPAGCSDPGSLSYAGVTGGGTVTVNIPVTCASGPTTGSISGTITSSQGGGLEGVGVTATPTGGSPTAAATTSATGAFTVPSVPATVGTGTLTLTNLPANCTNPGPTAYSGLTGAGLTGQNIVVTCTPPPSGLPVSLVYGPITNTGPTGRQIQIRVRWQVGAIEAVGLSFDIGFNGQALTYASRQFTSTFDFGTQSVMGAGTPNAVLSAAYGAVGDAFESGDFIAVAFTFNIVSGFSGSVTPTLAVSEASRRNSATPLTSQITIIPPAAIVIP